LFSPHAEGEARLLLLIDAFSGPGRALEGRTKLAKLDFFLRYPAYFQRALAVRAPSANQPPLPPDIDNIEGRMIRYRYGPWDPAYFTLLGRLIGKRLVEPVPEPRGIGFRTTDRGKALAQTIADAESWSLHATTVRLLRRHFDLSGSSLKKFIYQYFPEVTQAEWGERL
jgi:hypothetical protein